MTDLTETVQQPPAPPEPASLVPEPRARRQRWSAFEGEIARTIILPKLRSVWATHSPDTIEGFFALYRDAFEPDCTLSAFTEYLRILNIRTRRITVFEGLGEVPAVAAQGRPSGRPFAPTPVPAPQSGAAQDDDSFDNETPRETSDADVGTDIIEGDAARDMLRSLGFQDA